MTREAGVHLRRPGRRLQTPCALRLGLLQGRGAAAQNLGRLPRPGVAWTDPRPSLTGRPRTVPPRVAAGTAPSPLAFCGPPALQQAGRRVPGGPVFLPDAKMPRRSSQVGAEARSDATLGRR